MSDEPEVTESLDKPTEDPNAGNVSEPEEQDEEEAAKAEAANQCRAQLRQDLAIQLQKRIPKKPQLRRAQTALTGKDAEKYSLRCRRTNDPNNDLKLHNYNMHRYRLRMIKPVVNTSPPLVARNFFSQPTNFNQRLATFTRIERENAHMVRRIAAILEGGATVDDKLKGKRLVESNSGRARHMQLLNTALSNLGLLKRLQEMKPIIDTRQMMNEYKKREMIMERLSMYPLFWKKTPLKGWENHIARAKGRGATERVFLNLGTEMDNLGRLTIELNFEVTPMTAENFLCLCTGELGLSYKCSLLHRIVPGILWQGGDITGQEGYGNKSIYGETFPDENFTLKHEEAGTVSMANCGPGSNGSQFIITARRAPALDGTNVVFGKVISGLNVLEGLKDYLSSTGMPKCDIFITDCGVASGDDPPTQEESPELGDDGAGTDLETTEEAEGEN